VFGVAFSLFTDVLEDCVEGCDAVVSCVVICEAGRNRSCGTLGFGKSSSMICTCVSILEEHGGVKAYLF